MPLNTENPNVCNQTMYVIHTCVVCPRGKERWKTNPNNTYSTMYR